MTRAIWSWALYDWANSAFATTVMAAFFPIFFKKYWASQLPATESTFYLGTTMSITGLIFALSAPFIGYWIDKKRLAKQGLFFCVLTSVLCCLTFFILPQQAWSYSLLAYGVAWLGFAGGNLFYDSLIVHITEEKSYHWVSCFGYSLGYLGGGLLIILNALMVTKPEFFGFKSVALATKWSFVSVGLWWLVFSIPLFLFVNEKKKTHQAPTPQVWVTIKKILNNRNLVLFLLAYFFYIDGVHTIFKMSVDFALSVNLESSDLIQAIILVQFVGFPATFLFSYLASSIGAKNGIYFCIFVYCLVCLFGTQMTSASHFYGLAIAIGCVQGGIQALSRSYFAHFIPTGQAGEYFGFFNMFGKFSAVLGPFLVGLTSLMTDNSRLSLFAILALFIIGLLLFIQVPQPNKN